MVRKRVTKLEGAISPFIEEKAQRQRQLVMGPDGARRQK
jgi:hypothetical protein